MSTLSADKKALLAQRLRRRDGTVTITPRPPGTAAPLSPAQERIWFLEQYAPGTTVYTVPLTVRVAGDLDAAALERSLHEVVRRHEALRMRFRTTPDGLPEVLIDEEARAEFLTADAAGPDEARELVERELTRTFDLTAGPLVRALLVRLAPGDHVLMLAAHHLVTDGWSFEIIMRELFEIMGGRTPPPPAVQYGDYAAWQRDRRHEREVAHWRDRLAGVPVLDLPADRPRPPVLGHTGATHRFELDVDLARPALAAGATPYMVVLAAFQALLGRYSGQTDFAVGSPIAGRGLPELDGVVGMFVNTLAMRADLDGDPTFAELLTRVRDRALDAYAHQDLPFDRLVTELNVERDVSRSPVVQVMLALQNFTAPATGPSVGAALSAFPVEAGIARFDLSLYLFEKPGGLSGQLTYNTALFDPGTAARMATHLGMVLRAALADPSLRLSELPLLAEGERERVLAFSRSPAPAPLGRELLHDLVAGPPDTVAVTCDGQSLTYAALADRSDSLACRLQSLGVTRGSRVGIRLERSADLAVAVLAVLKAGGAYVPLDPAQPEDRLAYMTADAGVRVTVTEDLLAGLPPGDVPADPGLTGADLAYVIYTSGTTGRPKGVAVQHRQVLTYLAGVRERLAVEPGGSYALMQSLSFDFGITIFYLSLMTGGTLHLLDPRRPAAELAETLSGTDYLKATPSHLASLIAEAGPDGPGVLPRKLLVLGGEASTSAWAGSLHGPRVVNHYGPTEATVGVTTHEVTGAEETQTLPIGRPLPGARAYVLDRRGEPAPIGVIGEIHLGGDRLARGYLGRPALTAERFLPDPYGEPGSRMYRTGDLGRWLPSGDLQFLGRRDLQVKVRGYRVELTEIEEVLTGHPAVGQAVVDLRRDRLVAYLTGERASVADLRAYLADRLPEYMIPARYVWLDRLPLKAHGKVDRAALPEPGADRPDEDGGYVPPETSLETAIAEVWAGVLELDRVGAEDDFFELGGHSLLAAQVVARLRGVTERPVTIMDLFRHRTVRALAAKAAAPDDGPRKLLNRLTPARAVSASLVCVPYGGGSAAIYQPLADALPPDWALHSVAVPGQEWGLDEETRPVAEVADACVREILADVPGPLSLYGHCGLGVMLCVEIARRLEAAGRPVDALYLGGGFPFARPKTIMTPLRDLADRLRSDRVWANALVAAGLDIDELDPDQLAAIIRNRRQGTRDAEAYFTRLFAESPEPLRAPIISVVGDRDPATEFYQERYLEWHHLTGETAVVVLDEAGHFFVKHRAGELAEIVTGTRAAIAAGRTAEIEDRDRSWWLHATSTAGTDTPVTARGPRPSMKRFGAVAAGQLVSIIGSSLTEFAIPLWIYLTTGSLVNFALFSVIALVPGMLVAPLAGAIVDRYDRRKVMLAGDAAAGGTQLAFGLLLWTGHIQVWHVYPLLALLSVALTFQRLAYGAAVPQLVPKRYLGHANGVLQVVTGTAQLIVPLVAVGLMSAIGIRGILIIDVASYAFALCSVLLVRFPSAMGWKRRESLVREMAEGFRYSWGQRGFRGMLLFFACLNVFLSPLFLLLTPLVLGFATLSDVGRVSFAGGLGVLLGGLAMTVWGGPRRLRMRGVLLATLVLAAFCLVTGLQESLIVIAAGAFGMSLALTLVNGVYATIIQVKVPQRFHGRVIALNTLVAWSTLPIGFGLVAPYGTSLFEPLLAPDGPLASTVGQVIGVGEGRGVAFMYVVFALAIAVIALVALKVRVLARFDHDVPDAPPDDVIGLEAVRRRTAVH
ncbi:amino acid adenylation domain-containing protein [Microbispora sp. CA-102843]|uniref:amino acid adenylation domain-containing protein n=1 Tax=Microbispora sp. CA-102843 TaxID=3239952 RepID=UPI003D92C31E